MHYELNSTTCKQIIANPSSTFMEHELARLALHLYVKLGQKTQELNEANQTIQSIASTVITRCPYNIDKAGRNHGVKLACAYTPEELKDAVASMFPMDNPPFVNETSNTQDE